MEQQSDKLRGLLDEVKYDTPQALLADLIAHIEEDNPYTFFRYVQDLLEHRRIDDLLLANEALWWQVRSMYWERFQWLIRRDLKTGSAVPEEKERRRRLERALDKAFRGIPGNDYKEDWITEYLKLIGLTWEDVAAGRHLRRRVPGSPDPPGLYPFVMQLVRGDPDGGDADMRDGASLAGNDGRLPPQDKQEPDEGLEYQEALAKMAIAGEPLSPNDSLDGDKDDSKEEEEQSLAIQASLLALQTPDASIEASKVVSPTAPTAPKPPAHAPSKPLTNEEWMLDWQKANRNGKPADMKQQPYKGWIASGPVAMLQRIANFLSDEDVDRDPEWADHVAQITEYLAYLMVNHDAEKHSWGFELRQAIEMLRTHELYEDYHYGTPPLTVRFDDAPAVSERLPPVAGSNIVAAQRAVAKDSLAPRNLLHRPPEGVWDAMYRTPQGPLNDTFLKELRTDERLYWTMMPPDVLHNRRPATEWRLKGADRAIPIERPYGFNMCGVEDDAFMACMQQGPLRTHEELGKTCKFEFSAREHDEEGEVRPRLNKQLLQFAQFRGANRAALTFALRTLGSHTREIRAVRSPWRRLVVRTPEQRREQGRPGVIWQPARLGADEIPKDDFDPMAYSFWHSMLLESQGSWAKVKIADVEKARETLVGRDRGKYPPVPRTNFKGPYTAVEVNEERYNDEQLLRRLKNTLWDLETAARLSPRPLLKEVLTYVHWGREGLPPANEEEGMFLDDVVEQGRDGKKEVRIMKHNDVDLELLERMSHVSTNDKMLEPLPKAWPARKRIFADRVQALVADLSPASIFKSTEARATLEQVVWAVNQRGKGPVKGVMFTAEEAARHLDDLASFKRISVTRKGDRETTYSRPETTIHPEQTFHWDFHPSTRPRPSPTYLSYPAFAALHPQLKRMNEARTTPLLKGTAWRLGKTLPYLESTLSSRPTAARAASLRATYRDLTRNWERKVETQRDDCGARQAMDYRDVIRYAEPARFRPEWKPDDAQVDEGGVLGPVHAGTLREAHENKSMLWPAWWRRVESDKGEEIVWSRDNVWSWARPDVRARGRFFNVRRWPVHLQSEEMQERIRVSGARGLRCALGMVKRGGVVPEETVAAGLRTVRTEKEWPEKGVPEKGLVAQKEDKMDVSE